MRLNIRVKNDMLDDYSILRGYQFNYGVYPDDDGFFANDSSKVITRGFIIQVIRTLMRRKNNGDKLYMHIKGISMNMMRRLRLEFDINASDITMFNN